MTTIKTYVMDSELPARIEALSKKLGVTLGRVIEAGVTLLEKETGVTTAEKGGEDGENG